jgi:hydrogenase-4 component E
MNGTVAQLTIPGSINALLAALFLLASFGLVAARQMQADLRIFIVQSLLLAASAFLLAIRYHSIDLAIVGVLDLLVKPLIIPWWLRRTVPGEVYTRREINQTVNVPTSLLISIALVVWAYSGAHGLLASMPIDEYALTSLPVGLATLLLGAYTVAVRREAVSQLLGILMIENGALFAGIAIVPTLPLFAELATAIDVGIFGIIMGLLTRAIHARVGTTNVRALTRLQEAPLEETEARARVARSAGP